MLVNIELFREPSGPTESRAPPKPQEQQGLTGIP
jgi:hypothetical protein